MTTFDYFVRNPDKAVHFSKSGFQITPACAAAISEACDERAQQYPEPDREGQHNALQREMVRRIHEAAINYINN